MKHVWGTQAEINDPNLIKNPLEFRVAFPVKKTQFAYCVDKYDFAYKPNEVPRPLPDIRNVGDYKGLQYFENTSSVWLNA